MITESGPDEAGLGPDDYDFDPPDLPEIDKEFEPWVEPVDRDLLVKAVMDLDTVLSISAIESLLRDQKNILKGINNNIIDRLEDLATNKIPEYECTCNKLRDDILNCAADDPRNIPWLQFFALYKANKFFREFRTIKCYSENQFEQFIWSFVGANWWSARWEELVVEYGDRTLDFLI